MTAPVDVPLARPPRVQPVTGSLAGAAGGTAAGARARAIGAVARAAVVAVVALAALGLVATLTWPPGFDHGLYLWTADVVARGGMVYRDAWDMHGPLAAYVYALPRLIVGAPFWGVRLLDVVIAVAAARAVARLARRITPDETTREDARAVAWVTAATLVLLYLSSESEYTAQPDGWIGLGTAVLLAGVVRAERAGARAALAIGVAAGCFALIKPFYGLFVLVPLAYLVSADGFRWPHAARLTAAAAAASVVPIALMLAWLRARGALDAMVEVHLRYAARTYGGGGLHLGARLTALQSFLLASPIVPVLVAAAAAGAAVLWRSRRRPLLAALATWVGVAVFCVLLQHKYYQYHWIPVYPPLLLLAAAGVAGALAPAAVPAGRTLALASAAVIVAHAALRPAVFVKQWGAYLARRTEPATYFARFADKSPSLPIERMRAGWYLRDRTSPTATVVVWGSDPGVLHYARRAASFRIGAWSWPVFTATGTAVQRAYEAEYLRDLRERTPDYFVANTRLRVDTRRALATHPAVLREVEARFVLDTLIGPYQIWRRRSFPPIGR